MGLICFFHGAKYPCLFEISPILPAILSENMGLFANLYGAKYPGFLARSPIRKKQRFERGLGDDEEYVHRGDKN